MRGRSTFDWNTGEPTVFNNKNVTQYAQRKAKQTAYVERMRAQGVELGTIPGLGKRDEFQHIKRAP